MGNGRVNDGGTPADSWISSSDGPTGHLVSFLLLPSYSHWAFSEARHKLCNVWTTKSLSMPSDSISKLWKKLIPSVSNIYSFMSSQSHMYEQSKAAHLKGFQGVYRTWTWVKRVGWWTALSVKLCLHWLIFCQYCLLFLVVLVPTITTIPRWYYHIICLEQWFPNCRVTSFLKI
jgi:hypothetical protein